MPSESEVRDLFALLKHCRSHFWWVCENLLKVTDMRGNIVPLKPMRPQVELIQALNEHQYVTVLKSRKMGMSTIIAAYFFWKAYFWSHQLIGVAAHKDKSAKSIHRIYTRFHEYMPEAIQWPTPRNSGLVLEFEAPAWFPAPEKWPFGHGSIIESCTANTDGFRSGTPQAIHASEVAFWPDHNKTVTAMYASAPEHVPVIEESTPNGTNHFYYSWFPDEEDLYHRIFFSWVDDPRYVRDPKWLKKITLTRLEREYIERHNLSPERASWFVHTLRGRCKNDWRKFNQEFAIKPDVAFVSSGDRFFNRYWPEVVDHPLVDEEGWIVYEKPNKFGTYIAGIDTSTGSMSEESSRHACVIIDVTRRDPDKRKPVDMPFKVVAACRMRCSVGEAIDSFYERVKAYHALAVIESNLHGETAIDTFQKRQYPYMYVGSSVGKIANQTTNKVGYYTTPKSRARLMNRTRRLVAADAVDIRDPRLKQEANWVVFDKKGVPGPPEGDKTKHIDMVVCLGLCLQGIDQVESYERQVRMDFQPHTPQEWLQWEAIHGPWDGTREEAPASDWRFDLYENKMQRMVRPWET